MLQQAPAESYDTSKWFTEHYLEKTHQSLCVLKLRFKGGDVTHLEDKSRCKWIVVFKKKPPHSSWTSCLDIFLLSLQAGSRNEAAEQNWQWLPSHCYARTNRVLPPTLDIIHPCFASPFPVQRKFWNSWDFYYQGSKPVYSRERSSVLVLGDGGALKPFLLQ